jgi:hypothetical protein
VLAAALAGLDAREASDATVTMRAGKAEDTAACGRFVEELAAINVGWADGRGMRIRRNGGDEDVVVLEDTGLGAYTLLKPETGLHVLELPHEEDRSFDRVTVLSMSSPSATGGERRATAEPTRTGGRAALSARAVPPRSRRVRDAHGQDRPRAGGRLRPSGGGARLGRHGCSRPPTSVTSPAGGAFTFTATPKSK